MWSIHPNQIAPILKAFAPNGTQIEKAAELLLQAQAADWAPIRYGEVLHDRASYRLYWSQLQRAHAAAHALPEAVRTWF
jgi:citrate lyase subunit beta / citryl-CoA lyase